jgi:hypothetical protein
MTDASLDGVRQIREKAERARYHAALIDDQKAKANLLRYAEQLEAQAQELTSRFDTEPPQSVK